MIRTTIIKELNLNLLREKVKEKIPINTFHVIDLFRYLLNTSENPVTYPEIFWGNQFQQGIWGGRLRCPLMSQGENPGGDQTVTLLEALSI